MTSPDRHQRISELFLQARGLAPEERLAFLDEACAEDPALRDEVEALLAKESDLAGFLEQPPLLDGGLSAGDLPPTMPSDRPAVTVESNPSGARPQIAVAGYEIVRELHRGGQGVVYQAIQKATKRKVALKVLIEGPLASKSARKRFEREIELVAQLKHPNIIVIFDSGVTPEGWHYYAMDYIRGLPLNQHVQQEKLTLDATLDIFSKVCEAVQYAHHKGVIHRDLKPSNILVDGDGNPKLLDFGLAKQLAAPVETVISMTQDVIGTLPYMSPEQARGNPDNIDMRTDIYALGVVLYEMLTGHYPYPVVGHMAEVLKHIAETPPTPPSRKWTADSGVTKRSSRHVRAGKCPIDSELQTVILKTLSKDRGRRYQSAGDLARDLGHYLAGEPLEAKRDSGWYVLRKAAGRHRGKLAVTAAFLVLIGGFWGFIRWDTARQAAEAELRTAEEARVELQNRCDLLVEEGRSLTLRGRRAQGYANLNEALRLDPEHFEGLCLAAWWRKEQYFLHKPFKFRGRALLQESEELINQAMQINQENHVLWNLRSMVLLALGQLQEAEQSSRRVLELKPDYHYAQRNLAIILAVQGKIDEARAIATKGAQANQDEGQSGAYEDEIWRTLATLQLHLGQDGALESLEQARKKQHRDTRTALLFARLYLTLPADMDHAKALEEARLAAAFTTLQDPRFKRILAQAQLRNGLYLDAITNAAAAIEGGDLAAACHLIRAVAYASLGDRAEAASELGEAHERWPEQFEAGEDVIVTAEKGLLWFDTRAELNDLRREAQALISAP